MELRIILLLTNKLEMRGAVGVTKNGQHSAQVMIGTHVQQVADEGEKQM